MAARQVLQSTELFRREVVNGVGWNGSDFTGGIIIPNDEVDVIRFFVRPDDIDIMNIATQINWFMQVLGPDLQWKKVNATAGSAPGLPGNEIADSVMTIENPTNPLPSVHRLYYHKEVRLDLRVSSKTGGLGIVVRAELLSVGDDD